MELNITYRHLDSSPAIDAVIQDKVEKLSRYFSGKLTIDWVCVVHKNFHMSEVKVTGGHHVFHAKAEDHDLYKTIDSAVHKMERQLKKIHNQSKDHIHHHGNKD